MAFNSRINPRASDGTRLGCSTLVHVDVTHVISDLVPAGLDWFTSLPFLPCIRTSEAPRVGERENHGMSPRQ
jgi:hypothetical protein